MNYANIVFAQGDDATEPLELLDRDGEQAAIEYLAQWDYGEYHDVRDAPSAGTSDYTFKSGAYVLSYNLRMGYIGLEKIID